MSGVFKHRCIDYSIPITLRPIDFNVTRATLLIKAIELTLKNQKFEELHVLRHY